MVLLTEKVIFFSQKKLGIKLDLPEEILMVLPVSWDSEHSAAEKGAVMVEYLLWFYLGGKPSSAANSFSLSSKEKGKKIQCKRLNV